MRVHYIFDLDGTLLNTEFEVSCITQQIAARHGYDLPAQYVHQHLAGAAPSDKFRAIAAACGHDSIDEDLLLAMSAAHEAQKKALYNREHIPLVTGADAVLQALHAEGHLLSVATSNTTSIARQALEKTGLLPFFVDRVYGADSTKSGHKKPDPAVYLMAIEQSGARLPVIAIEDSASGAIAAAAAGAYTIAILDDMFGYGHMAAAKSAELRTAGADRVIRQFDLAALVPSAKTPAPQRQHARLLTISA